MRNRSRITALFVACLGIALALAGWTGPGHAQTMADLQIMNLEGTLLGPQGRKLAVFDYLQSGVMYRLMPGCQTEVATLDGKHIYKLKGPGVLQIKKPGGLTLNGKPVDAQGMVSKLSKVTVAPGQDARGGVGMIKDRAKGAAENTILIRQKDGSRKPLELYKQRYALVIGCSAYQAGWKSKANGVQEAKEISQVLKDLGWKVDTLLDPKYAEMRGALEGLLTQKSLSQDSAMLVWFSGHGRTLKTSDGNRQGYLVPVDAPPGPDNAKNFRDKILSLRQLEIFSRWIRAKHIVMIVNANLPVFPFQAVPPSPQHVLEQDVAQPVRLLITAGEISSQKSGQPGLKEGFMRAVRDGAADRNKDGYVTGQELSLYLAENPDFKDAKAGQSLMGKHVNPKFSQGDLVFALNPSLAIPQSQAQSQPKAQEAVLRTESGKPESAAKSVSPAKPAAEAKQSPEPAEQPKPAKQVKPATPPVPVQTPAPAKPQPEPEPDAQPQKQPGKTGYFTLQ